MKEQRNGKEALKVFIAHRTATCDACDEKLGRKAWITLAGEKGVLCLACANLAHLLFLPAGNWALTRRARQYSTLRAVVLRWSRAGQRYTRQGLLVEAQGLEKAQAVCQVDEAVRARQRERAYE